jgi:hypothetical protein
VSTDLEQITDLVERFFDAFTSGPDLPARLDGLRELFLPGAVVVRTCGLPLTVYDVDGFIAPRLALLTGGTVTDFREWETAGRTEVFGDVAHHWCSYAKEWTQGDQRVTGAGMKTIQFVRTESGWRIAAAAWDDARYGLDLADVISAPSLH